MVIANAGFLMAQTAPAERSTTGEREYYGLGSDPYQPENSYPELGAEAKQALAEQPGALKGCASSEVEARKTSEGS